MDRMSIIADSCCDLTETLRNDLAGIAPLTITIDGKDYVDDGSVEMIPYLAAMKASPNPARTACPSPDCYAKSILSAPGDWFHYHTFFPPFRFIQRCCNRPRNGQGVSAA